MPFYENVMIARPDISSAQMEALTETMAGIIKEHGGEVSKTEHWGLRNLAYRIKKNRKGHYALMNIDAPSAAVREMERNMRISEDVIRFITVRVNELDANPSAILQSRGSRDDRPGRGRGGRDRDGRDRDSRDRDSRDRDGRDRDGREREGRETREAREGRDRDEGGRRPAADAGPARGAAEGKSE